MLSSGFGNSLCIRMIIAGLFILLSVAFQSALYFGSLSWLAWHFERRNGLDGFHLVIAYAMGALVIHGVWGVTISCVWCSVLAGTSIAWLIDYLWLQLMTSPRDQNSLIVMIAGACVALLIFDWATASSPLAAPHEVRPLVMAASIVATSCWLVILADSQFRRGRLLRLGRINMWSVLYWARPIPKGDTIYQLVRFMLWFSVLTFPIVSTGLLSSTILKDVALGILMAKVVGTRGPIALFGMAITLAGLRTAAAYALVNQVSLALVEATTFVALLSWLHYRTTRTAWSDNVRR